MMFRIGVWIGALLGTGGLTAAAETPVPPTAADFAVGAVQADQYEIEAGWVARTESRTPNVRAFAQEMIDDHTRAREAMRAAARDSGWPAPPPAINRDQASLLAALQSLKGPDFDKAYARQQVLAHQQALAVEQSYASAGKDPKLRDAARSDLPMIQHHLDMARKMADALGPS